MSKTIFSALLLACAVLPGMSSASEELAKSKGCLGCHAIDRKIVGPAYKDVAQKYAGQSDAAAKLAEKVVKGGGGVWGQMPMPANPHVSPEEATKLVQWVLGLH